MSKLLIPLLLLALNVFSQEEYGFPWEKKITRKELTLAMNWPDSIQPCKHFMARAWDYKKENELRDKIGAALKSIPPDQLCDSCSAIGFVFTCQVNCNGDVGNWKVSMAYFNPRSTYPENWANFIRLCLNTLNEKVSKFESGDDEDLIQGVKANLNKGKITTSY